MAERSCGVNRTAIKYVFMTITIQEARAYMKGPPVGKSAGILINRETSGGMVVTLAVVPKRQYCRIIAISTIRGREPEWFQEDVEMVLPQLRHQDAKRPYSHSSRAQFTLCQCGPSPQLAQTSQEL